MANAYVLNKLENDAFGVTISHFVLVDILSRNQVYGLPSLTVNYTSNQM